MATRKPKLVEAKMESLCEELVAEIFDRVPIKSLARMKCVSKGCGRLVSHYRQSRRRTSTSTLFCQYTTKLSPNYTTVETNAIFLDAKEQGVGEIVCVERKSLGFSVDKDIYFVGSTNGLLLCCNFRFEGATPHFLNNSSEIFPYVCNPVLNRWISLPPVHKDFGSRYFSGMGLAFNGVPHDHHNHFQVVWFSLFRSKSVGKYMNLQLFSSHTGNWKKRKARFFNSSLRVGENHHVSYGDDYESPQYLFQRGVLHWILPHYMLVYHLQKNFCRLIPLPALGSRVMWESEGCLRLSSVDRQGIKIWAYVHGSVDNDPTADMKVEALMTTSFNANWQLKNRIEFATLKPQYPCTNTLWLRLEVFQRELHFIPCGFNEDLQVLYLAQRGVIASYSLETRRLKEIWDTKLLRTPFEDVIELCNYFSIQLSTVNLPVGGDCILSKNTDRPHLVLGPS